jgi:hypothetical protein
MKPSLKASLFGAACGMLLFAVPSEAGTLPSGVSQEDVATLSQVTLTHAAPAGARCIKWTRRWNTRHGVGHRRCVQWR